MVFLSSLQGLYVITDEKLTPYRDGKIFKLVEKALKGGAKIVQLRDKHSSLKELIPIAKELKILCQNYGALFIINDKVELVLEVDADGIHIGEEDEPLEKVRETLPGKVIGVSCYGDIEKAIRAEKQEASYVAFGSFFPSPTKPSSKVISKKILIEAKKVLKIPVCSIGGINLGNASELIKLGADMIAVISGIWASSDIEKTAREFSRLFEKYHK